MCNLYNVTTNQEAIRAITKALDRLGNLQPSLDIYPDQMAPIVRNIDGGREMAWVRWECRARSRLSFRPQRSGLTSCAPRARTSISRNS